VATRSDDHEHGDQEKKSASQRDGTAQADLIPPLASIAVPGVGIGAAHRGADVGSRL